MKRYYTDETQDPKSDAYNPTEKVFRPTLSDNDIINALRKEVFDLTKRLAEYEHDPKRKATTLEEVNHQRAIDEAKAAKAEAAEDDGIKRITDKPVQGLGSGLEFSEPVPAATKSAGGGVMGKAQVEAEAIESKSVAKRKAVQSAPKPKKGGKGKKS